MAVPWVSGAPLRQLEELSAWGEILKAGMLVAFTADKNDKGQWPLEGNYYLAVLQGPAYPVPESQVQAIDRLEAGCCWWQTARAVAGDCGTQPTLLQAAAREAFTGGQ